MNIQAPRDRAWARDKNAMDLLTKCLEVRTVLKLHGSRSALVCIGSSTSSCSCLSLCVLWRRVQVDPSKRISADTALAHPYFTSYVPLALSRAALLTRSSQPLPQPVVSVAGICSRTRTLWWWQRHPLGPALSSHESERHVNPHDCDLCSP